MPFVLMLLLQASGTTPAAPMITLSPPAPVLKPTPPRPAAPAPLITLSPPAPLLAPPRPAATAPKVTPPAAPIVVTAPAMVTLSPPAPILPSWEEALVARLKSDDRTIREQAIEVALAAPYALSPINSYPPLVGALWADGRRLQAAFWFYVFQIRSTAWALADDEGRGSGAAALRTAMNDQLGSVINPWMARDVSAWKRVATRAVSYEAKFPLYAKRPDAMTPAEWQSLVYRARTSYHDQLKQLDTVDAGVIAETRKQRGLPTGSLDDPGPPLPDGWQ